MAPLLEIEKIQALHFEEEREEEKALSFSDLPITKIIRSNGKEEEKKNVNGTNVDDFEFDFDFGLLVGSVNALESEMCSADEVFSDGQLLPFRHSVSSEAGLSRIRNSNWRTVSRSESMDGIGLCYRSGSGSGSRSSSIRSQYSSTSSTSTSSNNTSISVKTIPIPKSKGRNNFHSHPSPKPQVWASGARGSTINCAPTTSKKSTMWEVLRLGLVRTPEIELQDLKQRHRISTSGKTTFIMPRNNSCGSTNRSNSNNNSNENGSKISDVLMELQNKKNGGFFKSCKCSVLAIEPIPTREFGTYYGTKISDGPKTNKFSRNYQVLNEDKELAQKKVTVQEQQKQKKQQIRQGKKVMSHHHRTFEWLRDLSHANLLNS